MLPEARDEKLLERVIREVVSWGGEVGGGVIWMGTWPLSRHLLWALRLLRPNMINMLQPKEGGDVEAQHVAAQEEIVQGMQDLLEEMANEAGVEDIHMIEDVANVDVLREIVELDRQGQPQELIREGARMTILQVDLT